MATVPVPRNDGERAQQLELLLRTVRRVNSILELDELLNEIVGSVAETFGCSQATVLLVDDSSNEVVVTALHGFTMLSPNTRYRIGRDGIVGHVASTGKMHHSANVRSDPYYVDSECSTRSEVAIPLISRERVIGVFDAQSPIVDGFSPQQIEVLCALADYIAIAVENARLFRMERQEKERIRREQDEARMMQAALLPKISPLIPNFRVEGICLQVRAVGGDWFDYIPLDEGTWGVLLGDVSGKGMSAALLMSATSGMMRQIASPELSPGETLTRLNRAVLRYFPIGQFVTMVYAVIDAASRTVTFANAGHQPPLRTGNNSAVYPLCMRQGLPLGIREETYGEALVPLEIGESVVLYTDGVTEAVDRSGREFGEFALEQVLLHGGVTAEGLIAEVKRFAASDVLCDDATSVVITRQA